MQERCTDGADNGTLPQGTLLSLTRDLFFAVRIADTASRAGWRCVSMGEREEPAEVLRRVRPDIVLVELHARRERWLALINAAHSTDFGVVPVIAFGSHMDLEARNAALSAGATTVVANSKLSRDLITLLATYAPSTSTSH